VLYVKRILVLALIAVIAVFAFQNQKDLGESLTLSLFKYQQTLVLGFWLLLSFLAGAMLFMLVDLLRSFSLRLELSRRNQEVARLQGELARMSAQVQAQVQNVQTSTDASPVRPLQPPGGKQTPPGDLEKRLGL
jgi:uncharacterized integral membrane protein